MGRMAAEDINAYTLTRYDIDKLLKYKELSWLDKKGIKTRLILVNDSLDKMMLESGKSIVYFNGDEEFDNKECNN